VQDIPLLFEALDPAAFDAVVLVDAPEPVRRSRLIRARGLEPAQADRLIAAQMPSGPKRARSHIVIDNQGSLDDLRAQAREAWQRLLDLLQPAG
jgi:dephospho-CoA kinase